MQQYLPFTVLKRRKSARLLHMQSEVATVLTVYGIETAADQFERFLSAHKLQQYLPFTVLKHIELTHGGRNDTFVLQQYLPFTVLKPPYHRCSEDGHH